jgi:hypothetical protein
MIFTKKDSFSIDCLRVLVASQKPLASADVEREKKRFQQMASLLPLIVGLKLTRASLASILLSISMR